MAHTLGTRSITPVGIPIYAPNTRQFTLSGLHTTILAVFQGVRGTAGTVLLGEYFARIWCNISRFDTLGILRVLAEFGLQ